MLPSMPSSGGIVKHSSASFGGYDARETSQGAVNMTNMSSDDYPLMSVRPLRYKVLSPGI
jgi:hypothetical protein